MKIKDLIESVLNSSSSLNLGKGKKIYKENIIKDIKGKKIDNIYHIYGCVKDDKKNYNTHIKYDLKNKKVLECTCGCEEFKDNYIYKKSFMCEHLVATTFKFNELIDKKIKNSTSLEKVKNNLIYKNTNINNIIDNVFKQREKLYLQIFINSIENHKINYYQIEFKILGKRLYTINNLKEFIYSVLNSKNFKVNYDFTYDINSHEFLENDYNIFYFIKEYLDLNDKINESLKKGFKLINGKFLNLLPSNLYRFLNILDKREITFTKNLINYKAKVLKDNLPLNFTIKEKDELLVLTTKKVLPYPLNDDFNVFLYDRNIYIPEINKQRIYKEFYDILKNNGVIYFEKNLRVYEALIKLLKNISNNINLGESLYKALGDILRSKIFIERNNNNNIYCKVTLFYGQDTINFFSKENMSLRNKEKERKIANALEKLKFIKKQDKFLFIGDDLDLYYLLKEGIHILKQFGNVEFLNKDKDFRLYDSKDIGGKLCIKNKQILFNYNFSMLDDFELQDLFIAFKNSQPFYKAKNNIFIDLDNKDIKEFLNMTILLDEQNFNKGALTIDENKGVYIFNKLKRLNINLSGEEVLKKLYNDLENINSKEIIVSKDLNATLKPYQEFGVKWLLNIAKLGFSGILADDMGLGKTIQIIAFLMLQKNKKTLIVVPTSLIYNWIEEFKKFASSLKIKVIYGDTKKRESILREDTEYDVILTTYGTLKMDYNFYKEEEFDYFIIDEAQMIKNHKAKITEYVKNINSKVRFALTGTPIENTLIDLWSIFDFLMPGYLNEKEEFDKRFKGEENLKELKNLISPFILRREKQNVLEDLPEKLEKKIRINMTKEQRLIYNSYVKTIKEAIKNNKGSLFSYLTKLRLICLNPSLVIDNYNGGSSKIDALINILVDNINKNRKILIFSQFTKALELIKIHLDELGISYNYIDGKTSSKDRLKKVKEFNETENLKVFLISLKAGGTGLNLTAANLVIHFDPWWNPSVENQDTDRAYRIGQDKNVEVLKLICKDSIEEKIVNLQDNKNSIIDSILDENIMKKNLNNLTKEDILNILN